jgi:hypothetical protein
VCAELADLTAFALHKHSAVELSHTTTKDRNRSSVGLLARLHPFALRAWSDDAAATGPSATTAVFLHSAVDPQECSGVFVRPDAVTPFDNVPDMCAKLLGLSTSGVRLYLLWCGSDVLRVRHLLINAAPALPNAARVIRLLFPTDGFDEAVVAVTTSAENAEGAQHRVFAVKDAVTCAFALPTPARAVTARDVQLFVGRDDGDINADTAVSEHPVFLERDPMDPHAAFKLLFNTAHAVAKSNTEFDYPPAPPGFIHSNYTDHRWKPWALLAIETAKKVATIRSAYSTRGRGARGSIDDSLPPTLLQCVEAPRLEEGYVRAWYRMTPHLVEPQQVPATFTELPMTSWHPSAALVKEADIASPKQEQQRPQDPPRESSAAAAVDPADDGGGNDGSEPDEPQVEAASLGFLRGRYWVMPVVQPDEQQPPFRLVSVKQDEGAYAFSSSSAVDIVNWRAAANGTAAEVELATMKPKFGDALIGKHSVGTAVVLMLRAADFNSGKVLSALWMRSANVSRLFDPNTIRGTVASPDGPSSPLSRVRQSDTFNHLPTLTDAQRTFVAKLLDGGCDPIALWGPPGTGKTTTLAWGLVALAVSRTSDLVVHVATCTHRAKAEVITKFDEK